MSVSLWKWTEMCDSKPCCGDCDECGDEAEDEGQTMADYIDRQAVVYQLNKMKHEDKQPRAFGRAIRVVEGHEAADVKPVVHGKWTIEQINTYELSYGTTAYEPVYRCSACGRSTESYLRLDEPIMPEDADFPKFCPNCGADMREVEK